MADGTPAQFTLVLSDENDVPLDGAGYDTFEEAVEEARESAAVLMMHLLHDHSLPTISVYATETEQNVWYWCAPVFAPTEPLDTE